MIWPINIAPLYCTFDPILKKVCEGARLILIYYSMLDATKSFDFYGTWHIHKMFDFPPHFCIITFLFNFFGKCTIQVTFKTTSKRFGLPENRRYNFIIKPFKKIYLISINMSIKFLNRIVCQNALLTSYSWLLISRCKK